MDIFSSYRSLARLLFQLLYVCEWIQGHAVNKLKMNLKCLGLFLVVLSLAWVRSPAQDKSLFPSTPTSPDVASLGKYGDIPVSLHTGIPNISIPLYSVNGRALREEVSISYHAGGIKVEEEASRVGLGWSLRAGGSIIRTVRGIPDESANGWLQGTFRYDAWQAGGENRSELEDINDGLADAEPDLFYFNFGNQAGKFFFNENNEIVVTPQAGLKIEKIMSNGQIEGFIITNIRGEKHYFGQTSDQSRQARQVLNNSYTSCTQNGNFQFPDDNDKLNNLNNGWYLLQTEDHNALEKIEYYYDHYLINSCNLASQSSYSPSLDNTICQRPDAQECYSVGNVTEARLNAIASIRDSVVFHSSGPRLDLQSDKKLDSVTIYNKRSEQVKQFVLHYSYFENLLAPNSALFCVSYRTAEERSKRLRLDSISEISNVSRAKPPHKFFYSSQPLPEVSSFARDHWGYYNGKMENQTLIPPLKLTETLITSGADRNAFESYTKGAILEKIQYPTGGTTSFEYEINTVNTAENINPFVNAKSANIRSNGSDVSYQQSFQINNLDPNEDGTLLNLTISGVPCIVNDEGNVNPSCQILFSVEGVTDPSVQINANGLSQAYLPNGEYQLRVTINGDPADANYQNFVFRCHWNETVLNNSGQVIYHVGGLRVSQITNVDRLRNSKGIKKYKYERGQLTSFPIYEYPMTFKAIEAVGGANSCTFLARSSSSNIALGAGGSHITYGQVTEITEGNQGNNGKTVYDYGDFIADAYQQGFPFSPIDTREWLRGFPIRVDHYNSSGILVSREINEYQASRVYAVEGMKIGNFLIGFLLKQWAYNTYGLSTGSKKIKSSTKIIYGQESLDSLIQYTFHEYDQEDHLQIKKTEQITSAQDTVRTTYLYPTDLSHLPLMDTLKSRHFIGVPIITARYNNSQVLEMTKLNYDLRGNAIEPTQKFELFSNGENLDPAKLTNHLTLVETYGYDAHGNVNHVNTLGDEETTFIWSKDGAFLIAQVKNARPDEVYYNSFEDEGTPGNSKTGSRFLASATFTIPLAERPAGEHLMLSYWAYKDNRWEFKKMPYPANGVISEVGAAHLDEIRVHPYEAHMTTYTHAYPFGATSLTDENSKTSYYVYDDFGRVKLMKDEDLNIEKLINYQYKNE